MSLVLPTTRTNEKLEWVQALRGLAAVMVLFFHMGPHWAFVPQLAGWVPWMHWGFSGVDIFFVISGFVVHQTGHKSIPIYGFADFLKRRLVRIYLVYWPTLILFSAITVILFKTYPKSTEQFVRSFFLLYPKVWDNWLPVAWSLTYEIYFYFLLGLIILLPSKRQTLVVFALIFVLVGWNAGWLYFANARVLSVHQPLEFLLSGFAVEFMLGALMSVLMSARPQLYERTRWLLPLSLVLIVCGFSIGSQSFYFDRIEIMRTASYGLAAIGFLTAALALERRKYRPARLFVMIGNCSFSLYLLHGILLGLFGMFRPQVIAHLPQALLAFSIAMPIAIIIACYLWYLLIEVRVINFLKRRPAQNSAQTPTTPIAGV